MKRFVIAFGYLIASLGTIAVIWRLIPSGLAWQIGYLVLALIGMTVAFLWSNEKFTLSILRRHLTGAKLTLLKHSFSSVSKNSTVIQFESQDESGKILKGSAEIPSLSSLAETIHVHWNP